MRIAFMMGSNGPKWASPLQYTQADVQRMARVFEHECGYEIFEPTERDVYRVLQQLDAAAAKCCELDDFLVYYSGHAYLHGGQLVFLWDETTPELLGSALFSSRVLDSLKLCAAQNRLLILDCCHAGAFAGVKGETPVKEILRKEPNLMMLFASNRLETAREFDFLGGSFMAHSIVEILCKDSVVTLSSLIKSLRNRAKLHNRNQDHDKQVPVPYFFGELRDEFLLKHKEGPVLVTYSSLYKPDIDSLAESLNQYAGWRPADIAARLPVEVQFHPWVTERLEIQHGYLDTDQWPCEISGETREFVRQMTEESPRRVRDSIVEAVRLIDAAVPPSEEDKTAAKVATILSAVSIKMFAFVRSLLSWRLLNEDVQPWMRNFYHLAPIGSAQSIYGVTYIAEERHRWSYWTDADFIFRGKSYRVFVPQRFGTGKRELKKLAREDFLCDIVPQLLDDQLDKADILDTLREIFHAEGDALWNACLLRHEQMIDTVAHCLPAQNKEVMERILQTVIKAVDWELSAVSPDNRATKAIEFSSSHVPGLDDYLEKALGRRAAAHRKPHK